MAVDLNADMGEIIKGLMGGKKDGSSSSGDLAGSLAPYKNAIIFFVITLVLLGLYIGLYYIPMKEANEKKQEEIAELVKLKSETKDLEKKIVFIKSKLGKSREQYIESLSHFGNSEDLGELYRSVSTLAAKYDLAVMHIEEIVPKAPKAEPKKRRKSKKDKKEAKAPAKPKIEFKEIVVDVELKGRYGDYIKFKEDLAIAEMLLKVNEETIKVNSDETEAGKVYVELNLSTYAIDKSKFQSVLDNKEEEQEEEDE